ncbi:methylmalonyl-CoA mutase family protein [Halalkalibacter kiskunsagensis]
MDMTFNEFPVPTYQQWRTVAEKSLRGKSFDKTLKTKLLDEIELEPMYQNRDLENCTTLANDPGVFPFLRGTTNQPRNWKVSQEIIAVTPNQLNKCLKEEFARGQNVAHLVLTDEMKRGNKPCLDKNEGITIYDLKELQEAFKGMHLSNQLIHVDAGVVCLPLLALFCSISNQLEGTIASDPLHQLATEGKLTYSLERCYDYMALAVKWAQENHPKLRTILVQSHIYHNGGASPAVELASALATGVAYVNALIERGVSCDEAGQSVTFAISVGTDFFSEIAKIRAARVLWAAIMAEFGAGENGQKMNIHARTSSLTKTKQDTYVNLLRGTTEAFAAAVAGVDSLHVSPFDEALQEPTAFSRRIARNTSLILQEEAFIGVTQDPAGGSWYIEYITEQFAKKAWECFQDIERAGGMSAALQSGLVQDRIHTTWKQRSVEVEHRRRAIVGINKYVKLDETQPLKQESACETLDAYRKRLNTNDEKIEEMRPKNMEDVLAMVRKNIPIHQVHERLKDNVPSIEVDPIKKRRLAEGFELLRQRSNELYDKFGQRPTVYVIGLGPLASHKTRVDFITELFQSGGFKVQLSDPVAGVEEALEKVESFDFVVLCGTDESYHQLGLPLATELVSRSCDVFIAGRQEEELESLLLQAGVQRFIDAKTNAYKFLHDLQAKMGGTIQ